MEKFPVIDLASIMAGEQGVAEDGADEVLAACEGRRSSLFAITAYPRS